MNDDTLESTDSEGEDVDRQQESTPTGEQLKTNEGNPKLSDVLQITRHHSGPLPPPSQLKKYEDVIDDGAARIIEMTEKEQKHRHQLQSRAMTIRTRGMVLGFIISLSAIIAGVVIVIYGGSAWGVASIVAALATLLLAFIYGKGKDSSRGDERTE